jgi:4-amino-4-deoxy-L-arabinose transferase-like glycosyltransferase
MRQRPCSAFSVSDMLARPEKSGARRTLWLVLFAALVLRVVVLSMTTELGPRIVDEQHYHALAVSLVEGRGFASDAGPTSLRPPVYPAFVAAVWSVAGSRDLQAVRVVQALLGIATAWLAWWIGRTLWDERAGLVAAGIVAFYPALVLANVLLLTETLFTFLLTAFVAVLLQFLRKPGIGVALGTGVLLGLAALTRSIVWPLPFVLTPLLLWMLPSRPTVRIAVVTAFLASYAAVIAPWAVRNTRLQGVTTIVDTIGGMNLRMGNYEHTPHDRIWDAVSMRGDKSWIVGLPPHPPGGGEWTEGQKERWARGKAIEFMRANPGLTLWRMAIKMADFWGLDRDYLAGIQQGLFRPPRVLGALAAGAMLVSFPLVVVLAILGACLVPADWRSQVVLVLIVFFFAGLHAIVFGHPRYRVPLTPILAVFAGAAVSHQAWLRVRRGGPAGLLAGLLTVALVAIWTTQFVVRDLPFVRRLMGGL